MRLLPRFLLLTASNPRGFQAEVSSGNPLPDMCCVSSVQTHQHTAATLPRASVDPSHFPHCSLLPVGPESCCCLRSLHSHCRAHNSARPHLRLVVLWRGSLDGLPPAVTRDAAGGWQAVGSPHSLVRQPQQPMLVQVLLNGTQRLQPTHPHHTTHHAPYTTPLTSWRLQRLCDNVKAGVAGVANDCNRPSGLAGAKPMDKDFSKMQAMRLLPTDMLQA